MSIMREGNFSFGRAQFGGLVMKASTPAAGTELSPRAHRDARLPIHVAVLPAARGGIKRGDKPDTTHRHRH